MELKWRNLNLGFKISINSGAALIIFLLAYFLLLIGVAISSAVERQYIPALAGLASAFSGYLIKRNSNNKISANAELEKLKLDNGLNNTEEIKGDKVGL